MIILPVEGFGGLSRTGGLAELAVTSLTIAIHLEDNAISNMLIETVPKVGLICGDWAEVGCADRQD